jgi:hypothetical protein
MQEDRSDRPRDPDALVSDAARSATEWIGATPEEREKVLRDLLELADALRPVPERESSLPEKVLAVHQSLAEADIPHAVGGALAVGYYGEPRSTLDIDINVFIPVDQWPRTGDALTALDLDLEIAEGEIENAEELRLDWAPNSLHLFFACDPLHEQMRLDVRSVPFNGDTIPIVAPEHLIIRKAILDRPKDWYDIEQILIATSPLDLEEVESWLQRMTDKDDPRMQKLREVETALCLR